MTGTHRNSYAMQSEHIAKRFRHKRDSLNLHLVLHSSVNASKKSVAPNLLRLRPTIELRSQTMTATRLRTLGITFITVEAPGHVLRSPLS